MCKLHLLGGFGLLFVLRLDCVYADVVFLIAMFWFGFASFAAFGHGLITYYDCICCWVSGLGFGFAFDSRTPVGRCRLVG